MPKIDVGVEAPGLARARSLVLTDAAASRASAALRRAYGKQTDGEAWDAFFDDVRRLLVRTVRRAETDAAVEAISVSDLEVG